MNFWFGYLDEFIDNTDTYGHITRFDVTGKFLTVCTVQFVFLSNPFDLTVHTDIVTLRPLRM